MTIKELKDLLNDEDFNDDIRPPVTATTGF